MGNEIKWIQSSETSYVGYLEEMPMFHLDRVNVHTWSAFLSCRGTMFDTFDKCQRWCQLDDQIKMANIIIESMSRFRKNAQTPLSKAQDE